MKKLLVFALVAMGAFAIVADDAEKTCPISGKEINPETAINVNGKEVGFCCNNCKKDFLKTLNVTEKEELGSCPISGKDAIEEHLVYHSTTKASYYCCDKCLTKAVEDAGFELAEAGEPGKCPISGKPASADHFLVQNGERVNFCCENCPKTYTEKIKVADIEVDKCPISGEPAKAEKKLLLTSTKAVNFCCPNCVETYTKKHFTKAD